MTPQVCKEKYEVYSCQNSIAEKFCLKTNYIFTFLLLLLENLTKRQFGRGTEWKKMEISCEITKDL